MEHGHRIVANGTGTSNVTTLWFGKLEEDLAWERQKQQERDAAREAEQEKQRRDYERQQEELNRIADKLRQP